MKDITITELSGKDIDFDQQIDTDKIIASSGAVAVNGDVDDSAINTGINTGIIAGDDVDLHDSFVGNDNLQANHADIGALAADGDATYAEGQNVNLGSGQLLDVDAGEDAQVVTGNLNDVRGDVDVDMTNVDGPVNLAVGDDNSQQALEDNSQTFEDSFNLDHSVEDSFNQVFKAELDIDYQDNDLTEYTTEDSFNTEIEDHSDYVTDHTSTHEVTQTWHQELELEMEELGEWGDHTEMLDS